MKISSYKAWEDLERRRMQSWRMEKGTKTSVKSLTSGGEDC